MPEARQQLGSGISKERLLELKEIVEKAAQGKKTFTIFGKYWAVRDALKARGWVQNFDLQRLSAPRQRQTHDDLRVAAASTGSSGDGERQVLSRLLRHVPVSFVWATSEPIDWNSLSKSTIVSRFPRVFFTTKIGIASYLGESHWFNSPGISARFPRCYILSNPEDLDQFATDFRLTACLGLLTTLLEGVQTQKPGLFVLNGKVPLKVVEFAVKRLSEYVSSRRHEDIDTESCRVEKIWDHQWDQFLTHYYQAVHFGDPYQLATNEQIQEIYSCAKLALESVQPFWPQLAMDGTHNLWILKPGAKSRGRGIQVVNRLEQVQARLGVFSGNEPRLVIQKYIERPLLIYDTKFDIRQWFLVTSIYPLTIWMYKECYLRFCSHLFSLSNMHESVHLSNNAIQCKYKNEKRRDKLLPDENMWDSLTFQAYLRTIGQHEKWEKVIYPGMRGAFTCALLAAQDHVSPRQNTFELYGVDFMLTQDFQPWLIEINSSPCMSATTSVTARLCPQCLEDIIKVVIDRRTHKDADTGLFELAYRQEISSPPPYTGMNLTLRGARLRTRGGGGGAGGGSAPGGGGRALCSTGPPPPPAARGVLEEIRTPPSEGAGMREAIRRLSHQLESTSSGVSSAGRESGGGGLSSRGLSGCRRRTKRHCCTGRSTLTEAVLRYSVRRGGGTRESQQQQQRHVLSACRRAAGGGGGARPAAGVAARCSGGGGLAEWRRRVERTKLDCKTTLMNFKQDAKEGEEEVQRDSLKTKLPEIKKRRDLNNNFLLSEAIKKAELETGGVSLTNGDGSAGSLPTQAAATA